MKLKKSRWKKYKGRFKSPLEYSVYRTLKDISKKLKIEYETVKLRYTQPKDYIPDFIIALSNGRILYLEVKGYFRQPDRSKILAVIRDNPGVDLRLVFEKNNKLSRRSKMRYSDWATKHNIPYSINEIPLDWFEEPTS